MNFFRNGTEKTVLNFFEFVEIYTLFHLNKKDFVEGLSKCFSKIFFILSHSYQELEDSSVDEFNFLENCICNKNFNNQITNYEHLCIIYCHFYSLIFNDGLFHNK